MKEYEIFKFENDINETVVFVTSTEDLYYIQNDIFDELSKTNGENFSILVDLFLRNGFSFNRFVSLAFKGKNQCLTNIVNPRDVSEDIKLKIRNHLLTHKELLNNSALTKGTINFITTVKMSKDVMITIF
jgi:sugar-specific transcriptional regulator TrmB